MGLACNLHHDVDDGDDDVGHTEGVVHSLAICSSAHSSVQGLPKCPSAQVPKYQSAQVTKCPPPWAGKTKTHCHVVGLEQPGLFTAYKLHSDKWLETLGFHVSLASSS